MSEKEAISVETKTVTKLFNVKWSINKTCLDIAKMSSKAEKKGVIETCVKNGSYTFNLELCVPGWRRSQDGFSAFYLTVPRKKRKIDNNNCNNRTDDNTNNNNNNNNNDRDYINNEETEDVVRGGYIDDYNDTDNDFIARYTVTFGRNDKKLTRQSSIRNDFDLGVGFPNFTEVSTLSNAIYQNILEFDICVEIFERKSKIRHYPFRYHNNNDIDPEYKYDATQHINGITAKLVKKMYFEKINCDAMIVVNYFNKQNVKKRKCINVHKCILNAASPVFYTFFNHKSKENISSSIIMNEWNINTVLTMIKFIYLGKIELMNNEMIDDDDDDNDNNNDKYKGLDQDQEEIKTQEEKKEDEESKDEEENDEQECKKEADDVNKKEMNDLELECPKDERALFALFQIAECYEIKELSIACCHKLTSYITSQSCCLFLIYLDRYCHLNKKMLQIKNYILQFAANNIKIVQKTNSYSYLLQNKPHLLDEIITTIAEL